MNCMNKIKKAIQERENTWYGIYHDIGVQLDKFTTDELISYYIEKNENSLRNYIVEQIIVSEINKLRYK